jgi:hypothetical protein
MDAALLARQEQAQQEVEPHAPSDEPMQDVLQEPVPAIPAGDNLPQEAMTLEPEYDEMDILDPQSPQTRSPSPPPPANLEAPDERQEVPVAQARDPSYISDEIIEQFPTPAGKVVAKDLSYFGTIFEKRMRRYNENIYYPFANSIDWDLGAWMHESGMAMAEMDRFLATEYVSVFLY